MKKYITLIINMLIMLSAQAQGIETFFDEAIKKGRSDNGKGYYSVQFDGKNRGAWDEVFPFMNQRRYILISGERVVPFNGHNEVKKLSGGYDERYFLKFGIYRMAIDFATFITEPELGSYIANIPHTNTMGKAIIHPNSSKEIINVYWPGEVKNGWISGKGIGYTQGIKIDNNNKKRNIYTTEYKIYIINGEFIDGIPSGNCEVTTATVTLVNNTPPLLREEVDKKIVNYTVGNLYNGYRSLCMDGKYGFIDAQGNIIIPCKYGNVVQEFNNAGYAIVTDPSDGDQEIKINAKGTKLGYSDKQLQINEDKRLAKIEEEKRKEEEKIKKEEERRIEQQEKALAEARAEEIRKERIRNAREGDRIYYEQVWTWRSGGWFLRTSGSYTMKVICFIEKIVNNGERFQVRVASVESTDSEHYSTPEIDGIKYSKGDVTWIEPLWDRNWHM